MDLIQQDIFGSASDIKEIESVKKQLIKESSGGKRFNILEIFARIILFKPSLALSATDDPNKNARGVASAAHTLMLLFLKRLQEPDIQTSTIGKVKDFLNIIVIVLSHNTTFKAVELLTVVYISVSPFVYGGKPIKSNEHEEESDDIEIEENPNIKTSKMDKRQSATNKESKNLG